MSKKYHNIIHIKKSPLSRLSACHHCIASPCVILLPIRSALIVWWQVHYIVDEMLLNGCIVETNKSNILEPVELLEQVQAS